MPFARPALRLSCALAAAAASLALAGAVQAQQLRTFKAGSGPDELWDTTMKMEMPGMPIAMPAQTSQICLRKDRKAEDTIPRQDDCRLVDSKTVGNKVTFTMDCEGKEPMIVQGEITSSPNAYDGKMRMKSKRKGDDTEFTQVFSGRKVGACTDQTEQVVAKAKSDMDAAVARNCTEGLDRLQPQLFFGQGAMCAGQQKPFRDKVQQLSTAMREPAGFREAQKKYGTQTLQDAFKASNVNYQLTQQTACDRAVGSKDYAFLGSGNCDENVKRLGPVHCQGRDYYLVDRSLVPLCNRYSYLIKGSVPAGGMPGAASQGSAPSPQQAAQEPPKPDPVKQGVDAVRKLLPF